MRNTTVLILLFLLTSCKQDATKSSATLSRQITETGEKFVKNSKGEIYIVILNNYKYPPINFGNSSTLSISEIKELDKICRNAVKKMNTDAYKFNDGYKINLEQYKRQYFPYINGDGEKEVMINCLCKVRNQKWLTQMYSVSGGGSCYFSGFINLKKRTFRDFYVNSPL